MVRVSACEGCRRGKGQSCQGGRVFLGDGALLKHCQNWGNDSTSKSVQCLLNRYELISRTQVESWVQRHTPGTQPWGSGDRRSPGTLAN